MKDGWGEVKETKGKVVRKMIIAKLRYIFDFYSE